MKYIRGCGNGSGMATALPIRPIRFCAKFHHHGPSKRNKLRFYNVKKLIAFKNPALF